MDAVSADDVLLIETPVVVDDTSNFEIAVAVFPPTAAKTQTGAVLNVPLLKASVKIVDEATGLEPSVKLILNAWSSPVTELHVGDVPADVPNVTLLHACAVPPSISCPV